MLIDIPAKHINRWLLCTIDYIPPCSHTLYHIDCVLVYILATEAVGLAVVALSPSPLTDGAVVSVQASSDDGVSTFFLTSPIRWKIMSTGQWLHEINTY